MRRLTQRALQWIGYKLLGLARRVNPAADHQWRQQWIKDNGDATLRVRYDLRQDSVVFDLGGYEGQWASDIFSRYGCWIYIFEPVTAFADRITERFSRNHRMKVYPFGLAAKNCEEVIAISNDQSSLFVRSGQTQNIQLIRAYDFIVQNEIECIDLMKMNIEGAEYDLLDSLLADSLIERIVNLQVQFHRFVPQAAERMRRIQERLSLTHELTWQYPFVWENWRKK
ncbi:MAG: FkbM family methyltransferase [Candidatus Sumerlaeota bacterium]|nr:FkbM family methyltransferase [Candidatus Sumerlaeota bacterium]